MQRFKTIKEFNDAIETIMANYYSISKEELQERVCVDVDDIALSVDEELGVPHDKFSDIMIEGNIFGNVETLVSVSYFDGEQKFFINIELDVDGTEDELEKILDKYDKTDDGEILESVSLGDGIIGLAREFPAKECCMSGLQEALYALLDVVNCKGKGGFKEYIMPILRH